MDAARWDHVKSLFQDACDRDEAERAAWLDAACNGDAELRRAVDQLLEAHASAGAFLEARVSVEHLEDEGQATASRIGPYRIVREIGRGGMGAVYLAERDDPGFHKTVAIKIVRRDSHLLLRRFRTETQILAALEHPGIARLYDGGATAEGLPYFVMEYVAGEDILTYCDRHALSIPDRLRLFRRVCDAVQFAHQSFIVHRDLKPSNILITADGEPKLLDFGIAKLLNPDAEHERQDETIEITRILTPQYASPEHVRGQPVTTASDVYSLGVILYELLCGARPYRVTSAQSTAEIERIVCEADPPAPSEVAPAARRRALRGDLDNIVSKALGKDAHQRYATAAELADDVRRYLEGFPVIAQPSRVTYRAGKFVRRHRAGVAAAAIAVVSLIAGLAAALWQAHVADRERAVAERRFQEMHTLTAGLLIELPGQLYKEGVSTTLVSRVVKQALEYLDRLAAERQSDRRLSRELASGYRRMGELQGRRLSLNLGDRPGARVSLHKARTILEPLVQARPDDAEASRELATTMCDLARIEEQRLEWSRRCVDAWQAERRRSPADEETGLGLATAYELLADAMGGDDKALQVRQQAAGIYDDLLSRFPRSDNVLSSGALNHRRIGWVVYTKQDWPAMLGHVQKALDMDARDLQLEPANSGVKVAVGLDHHMLGCYYWGIGDYRASRQAFEDAVRVQREAYDRDPSDEWVQSRFLHSYGKLGFARDLSGDAPAAGDAFRDALTLLKRGHPIDRDPVWQGVLGFIHSGYGRMLARAGGPSPEACEHLSQGAQSLHRVEKMAKSLFPDERAVLTLTEQALAHCPANLTADAR